MMLTRYKRNIKKVNEYSKFGPRPQKYQKGPKNAETALCKNINAINRKLI